MQEHEKTVKSTLEIEINVKMFNKEKGVLSDAFTAEAKIMKTDVSRVGYNQEDWMKVNIFAKQEVFESPKVVVKSHSRLTKADSCQS